MAAGLLRGEGARALLRRDFREGFAAWLEESLAQAEQSGLYRPRMTPDFLRIRGQRGNMGLEEESLSPGRPGPLSGQGPELAEPGGPGGRKADPG